MLTIKPFSKLFKTHRSAKKAACGTDAVQSYRQSEDVYVTHPPTSQHSDGLTIMELFQSQGCSSCPPANRNAIDLSSDPNILLLTYEVTYWDYLGWQDTFGQSDFDSRQREYSSRLRCKTYTPQIIVNGRSEGVGNRQSELNGLIQRGRVPVKRPTLREVDGGIEIDGVTSQIAELELVHYNTREQIVDVKRGELAGHTIPHLNVVTRVQKLGKWTGGPTFFNVEPHTPGSSIHRVVLVHDGRAGPIIASLEL